MGKIIWQPPSDDASEEEWKAYREFLAWCEKEAEASAMRIKELLAA